MGQKVSQEPNQENKADILVICDVFSQGVVFASQKLKEYLGFEDPQSKFRPCTDTLNEIFLLHFISFCVEKGVEERITTSKMTKQQSLLFGVDWVWTLSGSDKQVRLQIAVQSLQMADLPNDCVEVVGWDKEALLADEHFRNKTPFEKLEEFCTLVGHDCLGLFIMFGVPGKPKDIRGVLLESIRKDKQKNLLSGENLLRQFVLNTDSFLPTREMLEHCLSKKNGLKEVSKVYINFL
ncbi:rab15 effector protein [Anolis carolinensis]|uniref:RAB15 effector protein n=1 Tax=Anolis carolinensis TaxID=28377 RepID=G1KMF7_ANOCA|nr:PREDICTED: rab15 effector protein [Anolis carolinensis]|eukprot:XP_003221528.1 PREDICTED: rab15 effector protein [Anolis carolinensis]